jgi:ribonuclease G
MSKEIYISSTPHETRLAIVEKEELTEIYYERENEYTLAGSIYNGRVTRVLPGMQSSFVDIVFVHHGLYGRGRGHVRV